MDYNAGEQEYFSQYCRTRDQTNSDFPGSSLCSPKSTVVADAGSRGNVKQSLLGTSVLSASIKCIIQWKNQDIVSESVPQVINSGETLLFTCPIPCNQGIAGSSSSEGSSQKRSYTPRKRKYDYEGPPLEDEKKEKNRQKAIKSSQWRKKHLKNGESSSATENSSLLQMYVKPSFFLKLISKDGIETSGELGEKGVQVFVPQTIGEISGMDSTNANVQLYEHTEKEMNEGENEQLKEVEEPEQHSKELELQNKKEFMLEIENYRQRNKELELKYEQAINKMKEKDKNFELLLRKYGECKLREETLEQENKKITMERDQSDQKLNDMRSNLYPKSYSIEAYIEAYYKYEQED